MNPPEKRRAGMGACIVYVVAVLAAGSATAAIGGPGLGVFGLIGGLWAVHMLWWKPNFD